MKETYYTSETIEKQTDWFFDQIKPCRGRHRQPLCISKTALLVLDMQKFFLDSSSHAFIPSGPAILQGIIQLKKFFLREKRPVIQTRHLNTEEDAGSMGKWWRDILREENSLSELVAELGEEKSLILKKSQYDGFYGTDLEKLLRERGVEQILITGVMTHLCCETTARSAFVRSFEVFFAVDGTATYNADFHLSTLINLSHGFAVPVRVREVMELE